MFDESSGYHQEQDELLLLLYIITIWAISPKQKVFSWDGSMVIYCRGVVYVLEASLEKLTFVCSVSWTILVWQKRCVFAVQSM